MIENRSIAATKSHQRVFAALILTSILSLGAAMTLLQSASASPVEPSQDAVGLMLKQKRPANPNNSGANRLPPQVANAVRKDLSSTTGIAPGKLKITEYSRQTWSDGCLGLGKAHESCLAALVPGWRVVLSDGRKTWAYRTDNQARVLRLEESQPDPVTLPKSLADAVLKDAIRRTGAPSSELRIVKTEKRSWPNSCLGLNEPGVGCLLMMVPGWEVTVEGSQQLLVYRTKESGSAVLLDEAASKITNSANLRESVLAAVLKQASAQLNVPASSLKIVDAEQKTWSNPCMFNFGKICTREYNPIAGWQVTVANSAQRLVYRTDKSASKVMLDKEASQITNAQAPESVSKAVLQQVSELSGMPISSLRIVKAEQKKWPDKCLGISSPLILCAPASSEGVPGWLVTVEAGKERFVYRTNADGSAGAFDGVASLPDSVANAVLRDVSKLSRIPMSSLSIIQAQRQTWDGCLGISKPGVACPEVGISGWEVVVSDNKNTWVYHTDNNSKVALNKGGSKAPNTTTLNPTKIPSSELPPSLTQGMVFRAIASGGIAGRTYETTLMNDGLLMQIRVGDANDSERRVFRVSPKQVKQFEQLLKKQKFSRFNQLRYSPSSGAADYINMMISSQNSTTAYADIVQNQVPQPLQEVIKAWNALYASRQPL